MRTPTENKAADLPSAKVALANALAKQRRHIRHRQEDGRPCYWCAEADREVEKARAAVARLEGRPGGEAA